LGANKDIEEAYSNAKPAYESDAEENLASSERAQEEPINTPVTEQNDEQFSAWQTEHQLNPEQKKLEDWLKTVPDNPGGLLKNKFELKSRERMNDPTYRRRPPTDEQRW